jgi:hypothetical protein
MQRSLITSLSLVAFTTAAAAQPAPAPPPKEPPATPADQPPTAPAVPPAERAAQPPPPPPPTPAVADAPKKLLVGKDSPGASFVPGLLLQGWFVLDENTKTVGGMDTQAATSTFRIRRVEISGSGEMVPGFVRYRFMLDPSRVRDTVTSQTAVDASGAPVTIRTPSSVVSALQDFYITFQSQLADVSIGQFKNTVSWEGFASSAKLILPERQFMANVLGGQRDIGVRIDKTFKSFMYSLNFFNGAGQNTLDSNNQKDVSFRVEIYPIPGLVIAGSTYDSIGYRGRAGTKDRWEGDLRYEAGPFLFQSEFIRARDLFTSGGTAVKAQGFYGALAYRLGEFGSGKWKGVLQPAVRVGHYDPNIDVDLDPSMVAASNFGGNDERTDYEVGFNYYLRAYELKLQLGYDRQQFDNSDAKPAINEVIAAAQVSF